MSTAVITPDRAYLEGLIGATGPRLDAVLIELDRTQGPEPRHDAPRKCVKGMSCGNTCIPKGRQCRAKASPAAAAKIKQLLALPAAGQSSSQGPGGARPKGEAAEQPAKAGPRASGGGSGAKVKPETVAQLRKPVLEYFGVKTQRELLNDKNFKMATAGDTIELQSREGWARLHRQFVGVPMSERNKPDGPTVINGLDVLQNFRPWHFFGLDPKTATKEDVDRAYRQLAKKHHPDVGGRRDVFERLTVMRDSVNAMLKPPALNAKKKARR